MIADRDKRRDAPAAYPVLVVGMAPSRSGHNLDGPTFERLSRYAQVSRRIDAYVELVNLLPEWPGDAGGDSAKWDAVPDKRDWAVGQRAALLQADLMERPRRRVVGLGGFVKDALTHWWALPRAGWLEPVNGNGPGRAQLVWSPHPAGTNMWWNDPANLAAGSAFWRETATELPTNSLPRRKVPMPDRSRWLVDMLQRLSVAGWPEACVDWPFVDPPGRPQALLRGASVPASHVALDLFVGPRPSKEHQALHSCDRGLNCVNPAHLRWGTELENRLDQVERRRGSIGKVGLEGAKDVLRKFDAAVAQIARDHGVTRDAVLGIALGKSWDPEKWTRRPT